MNQVSCAERDRLNGRTFHGYGPANIPDKRDSIIVGIVSRMKTEDDVVESAAVLGRQGGQVCLAFAARGASMSVRRGDPEMARLAAVSCALGYLSCGDGREAQQRMPLVLRAIEIIGGDVRGFAIESAKMMPSEVGQVFVSYAGENVREVVGKMGFLEEGSGSSFRFVSDW